VRERYRRGKLRFRAARSGSDLKDADLGVADGVGVVVGVDLLDVGFAFLEVEMLDVILAAAVEVDGLFVDKDKCAGKINLGDDVGFAA
jgi:hypothetical protein